MAEMTMVERVARAIRGKTGAHLVAGMTEGDSIIAARAAIEAMREPTREMLRLGDVYANGYEDMRSVGECWHAMIDAALNEGSRDDG